MPSPGTSTFLRDAQNLLHGRPKIRSQLIIFMWWEQSAQWLQEADVFCSPLRVFIIDLRSYALVPRKKQQHQANKKLMMLDAPAAGKRSNVMLSITWALRFCCHLRFRWRFWWVKTEQTGFPGMNQPSQSILEAQNGSLLGWLVFLKSLAESHA